MQTTHRRGRTGSSSNRRRPYSSAAPSGKRGRGAFKNSRPTRSRGGRFGNKKGAGKQPSFDPSRFINTNPTDVAPEKYTPEHRFDSFGLDERLVRAISSRGLTTPTPIQDQTIPQTLAGRDVIGLAETGTGKTAAFLIPLIQKTLNDPERKVLILAPTRELAQQIDDDFRKLTKGMQLFSVVCVGGMNINPQIRALRRKQHFTIGTPGRVLDLIERKVFDPSRMSAVVLDEADRMLDMGFINDMRKILSKTPKNRETLLFSATMSGDTKKLVNEFLQEPVTVSVKKTDVAASVAQDVVRFKHDKKYETLTSLFDDDAYSRVLVFGAMKHGVEKLARQLTKSGIPAESIHGNKNQRQRERALAKFKEGKSRVLVATDVAARGIHVPSVSHVINYDLPNTFDDYVHRIGRTGRGEKHGKALTFVPEKR